MSARNRKNKRPPQMGHNNLPPVKTKNDLPMVTHFKDSDHRWEDMTIVVIDHDLDWSDTQRKQRKNSGCIRPLTYQ